MRIADHGAPAASTGAALRAALLMAAMVSAAATGSRSAPEALPAPTRGGAALTNEDVVRLVMSGKPEEAVLRRIDAGPVDFDLSPDVAAELRRAGLSDRILEAMRRRQAAMPRIEPAAAPSASPAGETGTLEIDFAGDADAKDPAERSAIALRGLPRGARRQPGIEVAEVSDLALAVLCTTSYHVPDHWDTRSPLADAPRHEMLLFRPGSGEAKMRGFPILYLKHDPIYRLPLPEGEHAIVVGVAGKGSGSGAWKLLASDRASVSIAAGRVTRLALTARSRVRGSAMTGLVPDTEWKVAPAQAPAAETRPPAGPTPSPAPGSAP